MDTFLSLGQLSNSDLQSINCCWLAKCVLTVADIFMGDGFSLCHDITLPQVLPYPSILIWQWEQPPQLQIGRSGPMVSTWFWPPTATFYSLGGWLYHPHQFYSSPSLWPHLWDNLPSCHHGVWHMFLKPLNTSSYKVYLYCCCHLSAPTTYHIAFAPLGPFQILSF